MNEKLWVDEASTSIVRGWAVWTDTPQTVQVWSGGKRIDRAVTWSDRPDVVETYPFFYIALRVYGSHRITPT